MNDTKTSQQQTSNQTQSQTGTSTTTPNVPSWLSGNAQGLTSLFMSPGFGNQFQPEAASSLQGTAASGAAGLPGMGSSAMAGGASALEGLTGASAPTISGATVDPSAIAKYMNPYLSDVVDATGADMDHDAAVAQAALRAKAGLTGAFGGSGFGISQAELTSDNSRAKATTLGGLRSQAYSQAAAMAEQDADRAQAASVANQGAGLNSILARIQAATGLGSLGATQNETALNDVTAQGALGSTLYGQDVARQQQPLQFQQYLAQLLGGFIPLFSGSTTNQSGSGTSSGSGTGSSSSFGLGTNLLPPIKVG